MAMQYLLLNFLTFNPLWNLTEEVMLFVRVPPEDTAHN